MTEPIEIKVRGYEVIEKVVKPSGDSGRVYVPKAWVGRKVKIILLEPIE